MNIVFVSNFLNHHQIPFCEKMLSLCNEFHFVATENGNSQGYQVSCERPYVVDFTKEEHYAKKLILNADAVIFGACPSSLIELRMKENRLSFLYSERFLKKGLWRRFIPTTRKAINDRILKFKDKNIFVLCASAFLTYELTLLGFPKEKCFKWGYFPQTPYANNEEIKAKKEKHILWAGRLLPLKHPQTALQVALQLKKEKQPFILNIVGEGPEQEKLERFIQRNHLQEQVHLLGSKSHEELLSLMKQHQIFLFTSDFHEGWGAVLNEAMASGCAVVASSAVGSVPFLIDDEQNGKIYCYGKNDQAYQLVHTLLADNALCFRYGSNAVSYVKEKYNYEIAAMRLYEFCIEFLKNHSTKAFSDGVMSSAATIKNTWR